MNTMRKAGLVARVLILATAASALVSSGVVAQADVAMTFLQLGSNADGRLELFALGADGAVYDRSQAAPNGCWGDQSSLQGHDVRQIASATHVDGRVELFALGDDGAVYHRVEGSAGGNWGEWGYLGGTDIRQISATRNGDGRLELFAVGGDGAVWHKWEKSARGGWGEWAFMSGHDLRQIAATANADGRLELFVLGGDGVVYHSWQGGQAGGPWGDWVSLQGTDLRQISASSNADGRLELFAIGGDGAVWHKWQTSTGGGWGEWATLEGQELQRLAAGKNADGRLEVLVLGADGWIYHKWQSSAGAGWGGWVPLVVCSTTLPTEDQMAAYWAPVVSQDIDADNTRADYITNFDYDGDWSGSDNWENLSGFNLPANVYYWVTETNTHYFIGYAFFHPRDWTSLILAEGPGAGEHENDLEGVLLAIQKDHQFVHGRFLAMVTVGHISTYSFTDNNTPASNPWFTDVAPSETVTGGAEDIDGDLDFVVDDIGLHPVVYAEAEGHATAGTHGVGLVNVDDYPPFFDSNLVTDWRGAAWAGIVAAPQSGNPGAPYGTGGWGDGVIYHYEGIADDPTLAVAGRGLPADWQVIGYQLVNIRSLWERREDWRCGSHGVFSSAGNFQGDGAQAPWGWPDSFFSDPAGLIETYFDQLGGPVWPVDGGYIANSYDTPPLAC